MKVSLSHYNKMEETIKPLDTEASRDRYRKGEFARADKVKDLDKRYRWDLFWASDVNRTLNLTGYNTDHLDTALRRIVPPLS